MLTNTYVENWVCLRMGQISCNNLEPLPGFAFGTPILGFSRGDDPLYAFYKDHIDPDVYRLPAQWLEGTFGRPFDPAEISVISWALPHTADTKEKSRAAADCPPPEWTMARIQGEKWNCALAKALEQHLMELGYAAVAPMCSEQFVKYDSKRMTWVSNWSERHTAHICGLGTFGLCDGLISPLGKAVRYGSVIVEAPLTPTERPYDTYNAYCIASKGCTACIKRCPAGAITEKGHDKARCFAYREQIVKDINAQRYGYEGSPVCGMCQTGVPCESGIPGRRK